MSTAINTSNKATLLYYSTLFGDIRSEKMSCVFISLCIPNASIFIVSTLRLCIADDKKEKQYVFSFLSSSIQLIQLL